MIDNALFPFWTPGESSAVENGVFPIWQGEPGAVEATAIQGHDFAVSLSISSSLGHRFLIPIGISSSQGHKFAVALSISTSQGHRFAVSLPLEGSQRHRFAVSLPVSSSLGHDFSVALPTSSSLGHDFTVALELADTQGHKFTVALELTGAQGHKFTIPPLITVAKTQIVRQQDLNDLTEDLAVNREEPEQLRVDPISRKSSEEVPTQQQRTEDAVNNLEEWLVAAAQMQMVLGEKLKNRRVTVDAKINPAVKDALGRLFGVDSSTVTYDMYKKALEWRSQLLKEGRNNTYGTRS